MSLYPHLYKEGPIEPIVEPGQNVLLQTQQSYDMYEVQFVEPIPESAPVTVNLISGATLAVGATTAAISVQNQVDMSDGELGQFRFRVLDYAAISLFQGQALGRNITRNAKGLFIPQMQIRDPHVRMTEHFIYEQNRSYLTGTNNGPATLAQLRVAIFGFRYVLAGIDGVMSPTSGTIITAIKRFATIKDAVASGLKFKVVPVNGWGPQ